MSEDAKDPAPAIGSLRAYTPTYRDEHSLVTHLVDALEVRLSARDSQRRANVFPMDWCLIGILGPQKDVPEPVESVPEQADIDPVDAAKLAEEARNAGQGPTVPGSRPSSPTPQPDNSADSPPRERPDEQRGGRRSPSALGLELLLRPAPDGTIAIKVNVQFCIFTRHLPTLAEQTSELHSGVPLLGSPLAEVAHRWPIKVDGLVFQLSPNPTQILTDDGVIQAAINETLQGAFLRPDAERNWPAAARPKLSAESTLKDEAAFASFVANAASKTDPIQYEIHGLVEIRAALRGDGLVRVGCYLRNTSIETPRGERNRGQRDAFRVIGDAQLSTQVLSGSIEPIEILPVPKDYQYDRRVWGVGQNTSVIVDRAAGSARTSALARFEQPRIVTQDKPAARFSELAEDPVNVLMGIEERMRAYLQDWSAQILGQNTLQLSAEELSECRKDFQGFSNEIDRVSCGIAALKSDPRLLEAFKAMNRVFGRVARDYETWRLFQIVFIATQLPALVIREGIKGGTSPSGEALNWSDCLDWGDVLWFRTGGGKTEAYLGLTCCAMLYDRLRGKLAGITAWLRLPLRMLSIQQLQRAIRVIWEAEVERKRLPGDIASKSDPFRLGYFVGSGVTPNTLWDDAPQKYNSKESLEKLRVIADCPACLSTGTVMVSFDKNHWRFRHTCQKCSEELPLDISDDEVYRYLPTLLVGTVDKMASVGQQLKFGRLWGGAHWKCPDHGYSAGAYCAAFGCNLKKKKDRIPVAIKDPGPALHIQDELHLLQEDLGAFAGHYETLIRHCEAAISGLPSKIIAATATIEGFEHQVQHLYGTKGARRFPGRGYDKHSNFYAGPELDSSGAEKTARVFVAFKSTSLSPAKASARVSELMQQQVTWLMQNPHIALTFLKDAQTTADVHLLLRNYTTTLNYVSSLMRGSIVEQELADATGRIRGANGRDMTVKYTSSRTSSAEVVSVVHQIENPPSWDDPAFLDALVATNMISHGVDLERINLMTMDGVPEETAEYIQASSRSGRRHVGAVVVVLADYSLRSASIYHRFLEYHQHLDRMVSPVPVNRFAKYAAERTLPGIAVGLLFGLHTPKLKTASFDKRFDAAQWISGMGDEFKRDLHAAYAIDAGIYDERLERALAEVIDAGAETVKLHLNGSHEKRTADALRPRPMTSLRDVEATVPFWPEGDAKLMMFIQRTRE
jgi:hypothetical protein